MNVDIVDKMGSDNFIVNYIYISFAKQVNAKDYDKDKEEKLIRYRG